MGCVLEKGQFLAQQLYNLLGTQKWNTVEQSFLQYWNTSPSQMMRSCLSLSIHPSQWQDEKPGLLHTLKSGLKYWLLQRTGGFWKNSALNSFTSPPAAAAGSDHLLMSHSRVMWQHDLSQGLQACAGSAQQPSFSSACVQKEDMAGKRIIPSGFFPSSAWRVFFYRFLWVCCFIFLFAPLAFLLSWKVQLGRKALHLMIGNLRGG